MINCGWDFMRIYWQEEIYMILFADALCSGLFCLVLKQVWVFLFYTG